MTLKRNPLWMSSHEILREQNWRSWFQETCGTVLKDFTGHRHLWCFDNKPASWKTNPTSPDSSICSRIPGFLVMTSESTQEPWSESPLQNRERRLAAVFTYLFLNILGKCPRMIRTLQFLWTYTSNAQNPIRTPSVIYWFSKDDWIVWCATGTRYVNPVKASSVIPYSHPKAPSSS